MPSSKDNFVSARDIDPSSLDILVPPKLAQELRKHKAHSYDRISGVLTIDGQDIQLPTDSFEMLLCNVLFAKGQPVKRKFDRDEVRLRWDQDNPESYKLRVVSDAASRLNKRIENVIRNEQPLIHPAGKSIGINPFYL